MRFNHTVIESLSYALPEERWTSADIETKLAPLYSRLKLPEGRLELMTGIRERRIWQPNTRPSTASAAAGKNALAASSIRPEQIDLLIHCAVSRDRLEPATAAYVHRELGLAEHTQILDVSNACLGFLNALVLSAGMIESGLIRCALLTAGENGRPLIENTLAQLNSAELNRQTIKPFFANLTVGCAAVSAVVCHRDFCPHEPIISLENAVLRADTTANELCEGDATTGTLAMQTDSEELLKVGVQLARKTWDAFLKETAWTAETPDTIICHQVGKQHQRALYDALGLDLNKDYSTFPYLGNCGAVSLPITLAMALETKAILPGNKVALLGIGSGLSSLMLAIRAGK